jgi:hypothetical protein
VGWLPRSIDVPAELLEKVPVGLVADDHLGLIVEH